MCCVGLLIDEVVILVLLVFLTFSAGSTNATGRKFLVWSPAITFQTVKPALYFYVKVMIGFM